MANVYIRSPGKGGGLVSWDTVTACNEEICPIERICRYERESGSPCKIEVGYMKAVTDLFYRAAEKIDDEMVRVHIGFTLIPLYQQLLVMLKAELGVRLNGETMVGRGERVRVHPIYGEIREIQKSVLNFLKGSGLDDYLRASGIVKGPGELFPPLGVEPGLSPVEDIRSLDERMRDDEGGTW